MNLERMQVGEPERPFPIHENLVAQLLTAHAGRPDAPGDRDATVAHLLGALSAYAYADTSTVATIMSRLGFGGGACVHIEQQVDAMFVFSTAYLLQSRCGRVALLGYRGTEPTNLASWLGDADVGPEPMAPGAGALRAHSGFLRNFRATRLGVVAELERARAGRSLAHPERSVDHPLEALYVTGHSLGGAMATLFGLSLESGGEASLSAALRAIYTFGQPLTIADDPDAPPGPARGQSPRIRGQSPRIFRHVLARDPIPTLPAASWGRFSHIGHEFRWADGEWRASGEPVSQARTVRQFSPSILAFFWSAKRRAAARYSLPEHAPHQYLAALRPRGRVTELGDPG